MYPPAKSPRSPRGAFGREQWLARNEARRIGEWTSGHMETLQAISPRLMHRFRQGKLSAPEFEHAVAVYKRGGQDYVNWAEKNIVRRDPCFNPCGCTAPLPPRRAAPLWGVSGLVERSRMQRRGRAATPAA